jgi:hypothetical protein|tara:strand:- start:1867 stop:2166 length:300 start_codon:yes stop_codon:yes gene_type:complete
MDIHEINSLPLIDDDQIAMLVEAGEDAAAELILELLDLFKGEAIPQLETLKASLAESDLTRFPVWHTLLLEVVLTSADTVSRHFRRRLSLPQTHRRARR